MTAALILDETYAQPLGRTAFLVNRAIDSRSLVCFPASRGRGLSKGRTVGSLRTAKSIKRGQWTDLGTDLKPVFCFDAESGALPWLVKFPISLIGPMTEVLCSMGMKSPSLAPIDPTGYARLSTECRPGLNTYLPLSIDTNCICLI
jgi:hypothetical protein